MPLSDDIFASNGNPAVPGGNLAKPLILALLALLAANKFGGGSENKPASTSSKPALESKAGQHQASIEDSPDTVSDGLGELVDQFRKSGLGDIVETWINPGANKNVESKKVSEALGGDVVDELARRTGLSRNQVLDGLASILPGVVDKLTPAGRLPSQQDLLRLIS